MQCSERENKNERISLEVCSEIHKLQGSNVKRLNRKSYVWNNFHV